MIEEFKQDELSTLYSGLLSEIKEVFQGDAEE